MTRKPPQKQMWALSRGEPSSKSTNPKSSRRFTKVIALWIPRRFLTSSGVNLTEFITDVKEKVFRRGFVLWDGQLLTTPLTNVDAIDLIFEGDHPYDVPPYREWGAVQQEYFDLENPYQMIEDGEEYTYSHIMTRIDAVYLSPGECISAILNGEKDDYYFYCTCHQADIVYTTKHRLVCMGCGALHAVLRQPLPILAKCLLTPDEWADFFDEGGSRCEEEVDLSVVDFQDVETADTIWTTEQWEDAKHQFIFFARSSPEEIEKEIRGTEQDPSIFMEAGWKPVARPAPPAQQIADSIEVDLIENAAHSLQEGFSAYIAAKNSPETLLDAIPQLFRAVELLLKARLQALDAAGLNDRPNNVTVLMRLRAKGIMLSEDEINTVNRLRRFRNDLQHGTVKLNHRTGLSVCRNAIVFLNRFTGDELGLWIGDVVLSDDRPQLLVIPELSDKAKQIADERLTEICRQPGTTISRCPCCNQNTLVRLRRNTGASCIYCGHVPVRKEKGL